MKTLLAGLFVVGALAIGIAPAGVGASSSSRNLDGMRHSASAPSLHGLNKTGTFGCGTITCNAYQSGINTYFQDVAADNGKSTNVYGVATEFTDSTGAIAYNETYGGTYLDTHQFPTSSCTTQYASVCITDSQITSEINKAITANGWSAGPNKLFFILLPSGVDNCFDNGVDCAHNAFCAYHGSSGSVIYAVEPFSAAWSCNGANVGEGFPNGVEVDETINTISHEQNESITDPVNAWWSDSSGYENGDLCAWSFGAAIGTTAGGQPYNQVINGHDYSVQPEYSNKVNNNAGGCQLHPGGAVTPITGGSGPLVYHGGSVMRTNTVYTIMWLPAPVPAVSVAPVVTGLAAVGQQLSTTNGTWTNTPTSYLYKWQRCDAAGLNCFDIANATSSTYTPVASDAGHTLRAQVAATNANGSSSYASSAVTPAVIGKPAVTTAPKLSGIAKVGNSLTVSNGSWKYAPTSYSYQWWRCSSMGTSCKKITGASGSSYKLARGDAGHRIEAKVTATNVAGSSTATTKKSAVVAH